MSLGRNHELLESWKLSLRVPVIERCFPCAEAYHSHDARNRIGPEPGDLARKANSMRKSAHRRSFRQGPVLALVGIVLFAGCGNSTKAKSVITTTTTTLSVSSSTTTPSASSTAAPAASTASATTSPTTARPAATAPPATSPRVTTAPVTSPPATKPPTTPPTTAYTVTCHPLTNGGNCYRPGEFCRTSDHGAVGVAGNGATITCRDNNGWRWEP
jgi:cytoskeletal protein RodZ